MTAQGIFTPARLSSLLKPSSTRGTSGKAMVLPSYLGCLRCDGGSLVLAEASGSGITPLGPAFRNFITHTSTSSVAMMLASRRAGSFCKHIPIYACKSFGDWELRNRLFVCLGRRWRFYRERPIPFSMLKLGYMLLPKARRGATPIGSVGNYLRGTGRAKLLGNFHKLHTYIEHTKKAES